MRIFTKSTKVIGVTAKELDALADLITEARQKGKAERQLTETSYLAIEVNRQYEQVLREQARERK